METTTKAIDKTLLGLELAYSSRALNPALKSKVRSWIVCKKIHTHENRFIALSRLSNVAIASADDVSGKVTVRVQLLTNYVIVVLLYTELDSCPGISMLDTISPQLESLK